MTPRISTVALWRSFRRILSLLLLIVLIAFGTGAAIMLQAGRSDNQPADAAIVMLTDGAGSTTRLEHARRLYIEGKVSRILLAGADVAESRATLQSRGVKDEAVIELQAAQQRAQLAAARQALERDHLTSALLIAEPVEMLRLLKIAHDQRLRLMSAPVGADSDINIGGVAQEIGRYFRYVLLDG
ncbi:MAG TPA: ElyC/SanA/YdcF family protein [Herpetosiphonaceae bacterium]